MEAILVLVFLTVGVLGLGLWIWAIVDCVNHESSAGNDKLVWILIIVLAGWIGALIYLIVRRPQRIRMRGA